MSEKIKFIPVEVAEHAQSGDVLGAFDVSFRDKPVTGIRIFYDKKDPVVGFVPLSTAMTESDELTPDQWDAVIQAVDKKVQRLVNHEEEERERIRRLKVFKSRYEYSIGKYKPGDANTLRDPESNLGMIVYLTPEASLIRNREVVEEMTRMAEDLVGDPDKNEKLTLAKAGLRQHQYNWTIWATESIARDHYMISLIKGKPTFELPLLYQVLPGLVQKEKARIEATMAK
ncbi:MAG: hypothetical protein A2W22_02660 [Candidatus Levybacteria bacterium RBG_16_35_11]|nr:MAG: hypothetical protein A2W22_02660 [Candidatus Levybacteria bacterium RBG_16_35_11]